MVLLLAETVLCLAGLCCYVEKWLCSKRVCSWVTLERGWASVTRGKAFAEEIRLEELHPLQLKDALGAVPTGSCCFQRE